MIESEIGSLARVQEVGHGGKRKLPTKVKNQFTKEDDSQSSKDKMKGTLNSGQCTAFYPWRRACLSYGSSLVWLVTQIWEPPNVQVLTSLVDLWNCSCSRKPVFLVGFSLQSFMVYCSIYGPWMVSGDICRLKFFDHGFNHLLSLFCPLLSIADCIV